MFIYSALKDDTRTPPKHPLRKLCFMIISARWFHIALSCVIVSRPASPNTPRLIFTRCCHFVA